VIVLLTEYGSHVRMSGTKKVQEKNGLRYKSPEKRITRYLSGNRMHANKWLIFKQVYLFDHFFFKPTPSWCS